MDNEGIIISHHDSPLGKIQLMSSFNKIVSLSFVDSIKRPTTLIPASDTSSKVIDQCKIQLDEYFDGKRKSFELEYWIEGTPFQQTIFQLLNAIPFGKSKTYSELASEINNPGSIRAVGKTIGENKLLLLVPCHRVIAKSGSMQGYAGDVWRKEWLLKHEQTIMGSYLKLF